MLYNHRQVDLLLGCMVKDTSLANSQKFPLCPEDFKGDKESLFQLYLYGVLFNLNANGIKRATRIDIDNMLKPHTAKYNTFVDEGGLDRVETIYKLAKVENFEGYYNNVRKMSLLRDAKEDGDNISEFWDDTKSDEDNYAKLDGYTLENIIDYFEAKAVKRRRKFSRKQVKEEYVAGTDFMETKERFKESPLIGCSFQSETLNGIYRGMFGFILRGAKSGGGKSILSLGDLCKTTMTEYWDYNKKKFVKNKSREGASLFINTELELREELDLILISWISGVERSHIADGYYEEDEEERIDYANQVLLDSHLYIVDDPEFTCNSLKETIKYYSLNKKIRTCCFDYVQDNSFVSKEIASETKIPQRQDMVLLQLTDVLKQIQRDCGISLISSVQTNGTEDGMEYPTESCLAGGKSQIRKTNGTMIMLPPTKKELEQTSLLCAKYSQGGFGNGLKPNNVLHIVKGRNSKYAKNIKIFQYMDLGTGRTTDMYCTDKFNSPISVDRMVIEKE